MAKSSGSVRMGPISLFALVIILCLAVLAVLTVTTSNAGHVIAQRQAAYTQDTYANEIEAQTLMADVDEVLAPVREAGGGKDAALQALHQAPIEFVPEGYGDGANSLNVIIDESTGDVSSVDHRFSMIVIEDDLVKATFTQTSGRSLAVALRINDDATFSLVKWEATTLWDEDAGNETLWNSKQ